jgi:hypothetical protein
MWTGKHYDDEHAQFNFATPNSFLNHFDETNEVYTVKDFTLNFVARNNWVVIVCTMTCHRRKIDIILTATGPNIPAAMVQLLNQII